MTGTSAGYRRRRGFRMAGTGGERAAQPHPKLWRLALYIRLSREDGDKEESDSVGNQRELLQDFVKSSGEFETSGVYVDDGYSGTDFERPAFRRMMDDIRAGAADGVAVKDLSRLGRNYIEVGSYLEQIFPVLGVRFISVADGLDSYRNPAGMNTVLVPFKNLLNDEYCRDISNKIRRVFDLKRRQGEYIGAFAPYGYLKDPADRHHLLVDEEAAAVVREIFSWYLGGMSKSAIVRKLNQRGVPNPSTYKWLAGLRYARQGSAAGNGGPLWTLSSVSAVLKNQTYTGDLVQGRYTTASYKVHRQITLPPDRWIVARGTHEAIVSRETFEQAERMQSKDTRTPPRREEVCLFAGLLRCADCARAMHRQRAKSYTYYQCRTYKEASKEACTKHTIRADYLEAAVLRAVQTLFAAQDADLVRRATEKPLHKKDRSKPRDRLAKLLEAREREREKARRFGKTLYEDWKNGDISREEYLDMKKSFAQEQERADSAAKAIREEISRQERRGSEEAPADSLMRHGVPARLTREIVVYLIEEIRICEGGRVILRFRFSDPFLEWAGAAADPYLR